MGEQKTGPRANTNDFPIKSLALSKGTQSQIVLP